MYTSPVAVLPIILIRDTAPTVPSRTSSVCPMSGDCTSDLPLLSSSQSDTLRLSPCSAQTLESYRNVQLAELSKNIVGVHQENLVTDADSGCSFSTPSTPSECPERLNTSYKSDVSLSKPRIEVKLLRPSRGSCRKLLSKSLDNLDGLDYTLSNEDRCSPFEQLDELRSSFLNKDIHLDCDTLSRHLFPRTFKESCENVHYREKNIYCSVGNLKGKDSPDCGNEGDVNETYSMLAPQSYGDGTLKAVKRITDKYDSLQMRKLRARSFRAGSHHDKNSLDRALLNLQVENLNFNVKTLTNSDPCSPSIGQPKPFSMTGIRQEVVPVTSGLTDRDVSRVEMFYRSRFSEVVVCDCLADLQIATAQSGGSEATKKTHIPSWTHQHTGVPIIVLNTGNGIRKRTLHLVLAERETGFPLWSDRVSYLTNYAERTINLQAFHVSTSLRIIAAFKFYSAPAAARFYTNFRRITSDPEDDLWSLSNAKKKPKRQNKKNTTHKTIQSDDTSSKKSSSAKVTKNEISQPCHFIHVTNVNPNDNTLMDVFADYLQQNHSLVELDQEGRSVRLGTDQTGPILSNVT